MIKSFVFSLMCVIFLSSKLSATQVWSYTSEQMHDMASAFVKFRKEKENLTFKDDWLTILHMAEYKGYIASTLDNQNAFDKCVKTHTVNNIAQRSAAIISSNKKTNREAIAMVNVLVAIDMACNDDNWK